MKIPVSCPHCSMVIPVPVEKIPPKPVTFPCPGCSGKVPIDGSRIREDGTMAPEEAPKAVTQAPPVEAPRVEAPQVEAPRVEAPQVEAPRVEAPPAMPPAEESGIDILEHVEIPDGTTLPSGLLISESPELTDALRISLGTLESRLKECSSTSEARELTTMQLSPLMIYAGTTISNPPFVAIEPIISIDPNRRRRTFIVLVGDNVTTLDGNAAFYYGVDLVVNSKDAHRAHKAIFSAIEFDKTLTGFFLDSLREVEGV